MKAPFEAENDFKQIMHVSHGGCHFCFVLYVCRATWNIANECIMPSMLFFIDVRGQIFPARAEACVRQYFPKPLRPQDPGGSIEDQWGPRWTHKSHRPPVSDYFWWRLSGNIDLLMFTAGPPWGDRNTAGLTSSVPPRRSHGRVTLIPSLLALMEGITKFVFCPNPPVVIISLPFIIINLLDLTVERRSWSSRGSVIIHNIAALAKQGGNRIGRIYPPVGQCAVSRLSHYQWKVFGSIHQSVHPSVCHTQNPGFSAYTQHWVL